MGKAQERIRERRSEDLILEPGACKNVIIVDDATVECLARGIVPEALCERMWRLLGVEREQRRIAAAQQTEAPDQWLKRAASTTTVFDEEAAEVSR